MDLRDGARMRWHRGSGSGGDQQLLRKAIREAFLPRAICDGASRSRSASTPVEKRVGQLVRYAKALSVACCFGAQPLIRSDRPTAFGTYVDQDREAIVVHGYQEGLELSRSGAEIAASDVAPRSVQERL